MYMTTDKEIYDEVRSLTGNNLEDILSELMITNKLLLRIAERISWVTGER